jgi:saccharopine dehydrogenase (NAD+, L-lysine-forming)
MMLFQGHWKAPEGEKGGVFNVEQLPPKPFLEELGKQGLPWHVRQIKKKEQKDLFDVET